MELLERYLYAVGQHLPARTKADTLAELRANLLAEMEGRQEEQGRPLTEAEVAAVLEQHGRPVLVAARYLPQQSLIGPTLFPVYWFTLKKSFPLVVLAYAVLQAVTLAAHGYQGIDVGAEITHFAGVVLTFWGIVTLGFALFEYAQGRYIAPVQWSKAWNPRDLPPVEREKTPSLAARVADLVMMLAVLAVLLAFPTHPYLVLGPGWSLTAKHFGLSPQAHALYWQIVGLMALTLPLKVAALLRRARPWLKHLDLGTKALSILALIVIVQVRTYIVPGMAMHSLPDLRQIADINQGLNLAFRLVLVISALKFAWDLWKMVTGERKAPVTTAA